MPPPQTMTAWRRWAALAVLVLPVLLISIDMTVLGFAVPALTEDLSPSGVQLLWIVDIYSFLLAGLLVLMGNLGDRIGRRRLLMTGAVLFGIASLIAAFAPTAETLIAARAILGVGGATLMPSTLSIIRNVFMDDTERRVAIAVWSSAFAGGAALGPILGGWLLEHFWWGSVFLINVPVMAALLVGAALLLPESRNPTPGPFDAVSALLSIAGMLTFVYGLKEVGTGAFSLVGIATLFIGIVIMVAFARRQLRRPDPLLDLRLFQRPTFAVSVSANLMTLVVFLPLLLLVPQYLQVVLEKTPMVAGLWMLPMALASAAGALGAPIIARRVATQNVIGTGFLLAAAGFVVGTQLTPSGEMGTFLALSALTGIGIGVIHPLTNDVILQSGPPERVGGAASISETAYELGAAIGIACLGTLAMAIYRSRLGSELPGIHADDMLAARQTIGGAEKVAKQLPAGTADTLTGAANHAFSSGLMVVCIVSAFLSVVCAGLTWWMLRRITKNVPTPPTAALHESTSP